MNPFDMTGPQFLQLYALLAVTVLILAYLLRQFLRQPGGEPLDDELKLLPYETAYLAGGEALAINAALASLVQSKVLSVSPTSRKVFPGGGELPKDADPIEQALARVHLAEDGKLLKDVRDAAQREAERLRGPLQKADLVLSASSQWTAQFLPALLVLGLAGFGAAKIVIGTLREKNVGYLVMACIATAVVAILFVSRSAHRTLRGDRVLERLREEHAALKTTAGSNIHLVTGAALPMAVGLFGLGLLSGAGPLDDLRTGLNANGGSFSSGGCGSGCGSSCGGGDGGGGGCGGCGGGGD